MNAPALNGVLTLPDGTRVRGRSLRRFPERGPSPTHGLYLGTSRTRRKYARAMPWSQDWIEWRDFGLPKHRPAAVAAITDLHSAIRRGDLAECACWGGVGRTGTVLACLVVMTGYSGPEAVAWVRERYAARAVETRGQRRWVEQFATDAI